MTDSPELPAGTTPPVPGRRRAFAIGALAVVALVAAVLAFLQFLDARDLRDERDDRSEIAEVTSEFGSAYLTYEPDDFDASVEAIKALGTTRFREVFEETREPGLRQFVEGGASTRATTEEVFVGDVEGGQARALVVIEVTVGSADVGEQDPFGLSYIVDLVREDGNWRIDQVGPAEQPSTGLPTGSTSSTSAPSTSTTSAPEDP